MRVIDGLGQASVPWKIPAKVAVEGLQMRGLILVLSAAAVLLSACAIPADTPGAYGRYPEYTLGRV
jgi:hypothetical protein